MRTGTHFTTTDLADFRARERRMLVDILIAWEKHGLPENFYTEEVRPMMIRSSGNVFLTNSEFQVAMLTDENKLEMWHSCPNCGHEGFSGDCDINEDNECNECAESEGLFRRNKKRGCFSSPSTTQGVSMKNLPIPHGMEKRFKNQEKIIDIQDDLLTVLESYMDELEPGEVFYHSIKFMTIALYECADSPKEASKVLRLAMDYGIVAAMEQRKDH